MAAPLLTAGRRGGGGATAPLPPSRAECSAPLPHPSPTPPPPAATPPPARRQILAKAELLNPGGSVKDRVALEIVAEAIAEGRLAAPGGLITEATAGSTGISLSLVARAVGCRCFIAMPDDAAIEKAQTLQALGAAGGRVATAIARGGGRGGGGCPRGHAARARKHSLPRLPWRPQPPPPPRAAGPAGTEVLRLRPVSIVHPDHPVNVARQRAAAEGPGSIFADQFENLANMRAHLQTGAWRSSGFCWGRRPAGLGGFRLGAQRFRPPGAPP
jgi:hypothetical protein